MNTIFTWAAAGIIGLGLIMVIAGLRQATIAAADERSILAAQLRDLMRTVKEMSLRIEGFGHKLEGFAKNIPRELDIAALAVELTGRMKASSERDKRPEEPAAVRVEPVEILLAWWNRSRLSASSVAAALPSLRSELPGFSIAQVEMARGLVGLTFSPLLPGGFRETIILPEMSFRVGDLKAVFTAPLGTSDMCRIQRTIKPASVETQYHGAARTELVNYGMVQGLIEPGDAL